MSKSKLKICAVFGKRNVIRNWEGLDELMQFINFKLVGRSEACKNFTQTIVCKELPNNQVQVSFEVKDKYYVR